MGQPDSLLALRLRLIFITCLGLAGAVAFIILYWVFSGSLEEIETIFAGIVFVLIIAGIAFLAHKGQPTVACWLLVGLLFLLITLDLLAYGITTPSAAAYVIPILLAAFCLGLWPSLTIAGLGTVAAWLIAWLKTSSAHTQPPADISQLTFNAPALTIVLLITGLMAGFWAHSVQSFKHE